MPTENFSLSEQQARFIHERVDGGRYGNPSEVVGAALQLLERQERQEELKLEILRRLATESFEEFERGEYIEVQPDGIEQFVEELAARARGPGMKFRLRFSRRATQDIEDALAHTLAHFGLQKFEQYQNLICDALAHLEARPTAAPAKVRRDIHPDAMTLHISQRRRPARHLFLYRIIDGQHIVQIGRLLHDAMDPRKHLPEDFRDK